MCTIYHIMSNKSFNFGFKPPSATATATSAIQQNENAFGTNTTAPLQFGIRSNVQTGTSSSTPISSMPLQFNLGQTTTGTSFSLGGTATPSLNLTSTPVSATGGAAFVSVTTSASGSQTQSFISPANTTSTTVKSFTGLTTTSAPSFGVSAGFTFGSNTTSTALSTPTTFGGSDALQYSVVSAVTSASNLKSTVGLGGISTDVKTTSSVSTQKEISPKDQSLPNEILHTVESFKKFVKNEKGYSSDISRCSAKEYKKVEDDIDILINTLNDIEYDLHKYRGMTEKLKYDVAKGLQYIEMAQRTQDTPPGLQYDNTTPMQFFMDLTDNFEKDMHTLKTQLEAIEKWTKSSQHLSNITSEDISLGMKRLHETFVALAGQFQTLHNQVEAQKEKFLNLRRTILNDPSNIFDDSKININNEGIHNNPHTVPLLPAGPTPFNTVGKTQAYLISQIVNPGVGVANQSQDSFVNSTPFGLPNTSFSMTSHSPFQLNKPPIGNKRGKM